ncbi:maleylacetate reductase [Euzebya pacifica]|uniref:maleylacetate reductase n=1 Tax=Euzebya pacifica TaxID=1608957 RepID=UPI0013DF036C|nr:maleylacetate reductase [Euzebya pacifica]
MSALPPLSPTSFTYEPAAGRVVFGRGALASLPDELDRLGSRRAVLVAEPRDADVADLDPRIGGHVDTVVQHVPAAVADAAREQVRELGGDVLVVVGGGSAIGLAKAVALTVDVHLLAVPTTFAGSEQTSIWGMSADGRKRTGRDERVRARTVVYDPNRSGTMPPQVAGPSGMNAIAHAVEAMYGPGANPVTTLLAAEAVRIMAAALPRVVTGAGAGGGVADPAADALYGSYLAGIVLDTAGVALHHRTCHVLGGMFGLDHGGMNAAILGHALAYTAPAIQPVIARLAEALQVNDPAVALHQLAERIGAPTALEELGMPADGIEEAAGRVVEEAADNPRPPEHDAIAAMLRRAFAGKAPEREG